MRFIIIFLILTSTCRADQGLIISCLNMLTVLGQEYKKEYFSLDAIHFKYYESDSNNLKIINTKDLIIGDDYFKVRLKDYELGFHNVLFKDDKKERMVMSKYDYKNEKFLDHYLCDYKVSEIN